jgi:uncharacterized protein (DUF934 family)
MRLVKAGQAIEDRFVRVLDDAPVPENVPVLLPATRFLADSAELAGRNAPVGVLWPNNRRVAELEPHLGRLALIALSFPTFRDGRAYSQARQLRERYGFAGELRATGDILQDEFVFLIRSGFDALEVKKDSDVAAFADALRRYSVFYQPAADGRLAAFRQRLARLQPAHSAPATARRN